MMAPFRGHMSLKSSPFSPGPSCKLSNQCIIQDHMAAHYKKLMSAKAAVDSSAPKSLHTSVKYKDQQKRDRLIQAFEKYKKDLVPGLPGSPFNSRSVSPSQQKKLTSRTVMPAPTARKTFQNNVQHALSQTPVHNSSTHRSSASPLLQSRMHLGSHNRKKAFQNSFNKTYSEDLLDKYSSYFTEKKQPFTPQILKTSHQSFLLKYRYYNPPPPKKSSSSSRPSLESADVNNKKKRELHRFLEDAYMRPRSDQFSQQPVEQNHKLWIPSSEMPLSPGSKLEKEEAYLRFLQDLTNDILIRNCYHKEALEDVFQMHIKSKRHNLDELHPSLPSVVTGPADSSEGACCKPTGINNGSAVPNSATAMPPRTSSGRCCLRKCTSPC